MDLREAEARLDEILAGAQEWLPAEQLAEMRGLLAAGEPGVTLENFCTQLEEFDVMIPVAVVDELMGLAVGMGISLSPWIGSRA
jgi:hypothetical protein